MARSSHKSMSTVVKPTVVKPSAVQTNVEKPTLTNTLTHSVASGVGTGIGFQAGSAIFGSLFGSKPAPAVSPDNSCTKIQKAFTECKEFSDDSASCKKMITNLFDVDSFKKCIPESHIF